MAGMPRHFGVLRLYLPEGQRVRAALQRTAATLFSPASRASEICSRTMCLGARDTRRMTTDSALPRKRAGKPRSHIDHRLQLLLALRGRRPEFGFQLLRAALRSQRGGLQRTTARTIYAGDPPVGIDRDIFRGLVGGFYTHEDYNQDFTFPAIETTTGAVAGDFGGDNVSETYQEYAAFADVTAHVTDRLDVQLGLGDSHDQQPATRYLYTGDYARTFTGQIPTGRLLRRCRKIPSPTWLHRNSGLPRT